jgi:hypothetical protein
MSHISPIRRFKVMIVLGPVVGALCAPASVSGVVIEQLPLQASVTPARFVFSWPGGAGLSGASGALYEAVSVQPFKVTPGPAGGEVVATAPAPNGSTWFLTYSMSTAMVAPELYEMTGTGAVGRDVLPSLESSAYDSPTSFAFGADGTVWLARPDGIDRYTPGGTDKLYPVSGYPYQIVAGPDGALWFTQPVASEIGRVNLSGEISEYLLSGARTIYETPAEPWAIAVGPEGDVWFTEENLGRIGRLTVGGELREFAIPLPRGLPTGIASRPEPKFITTGPEGNMWFTDPGTNSIGRVTQAGEVAEYPISPVSSSAGGKQSFEVFVPSAITSVPQGLLFSERDVKAIGFVDPNAQPASQPYESSVALRHTANRLRLPQKCTHGTERRGRRRRVRGRCSRASRHRR